MLKCSCRSVDVRVRNSLVRSLPLYYSGDLSGFGVASVAALCARFCYAARNFVDFYEAIVDKQKQPEYIRRQIGNVSNRSKEHGTHGVTQCADNHLETD